MHSSAFVYFVDSIEILELRCQILFEYFAKNILHRGNDLRNKPNKMNGLYVSETNRNYSLSDDYTRIYS